MTWSRAIRWAAVAVGAVLVVLAIVAGAGSRTPTLRRLVVETLADRLDSEIELAAFSVDTFPTVDIRGEGLAVRLRGARDVPPLVRIERFTITGGMFGLLSRPRRFSTIRLEGLEINIPPGGPDFDASKKPADNDSADHPSSPIHIDSLEASNAVLRLIPRQAGKTPREFAIHRLAMTGVGASSRMPFEAELTNPIPRGQIRTHGQFGPWNKTHPGGTPLEGQYVFEQADLATIKGIGGMLASTGWFGGELGRIAVEGETRTPDFRLKYADRPMPLTTTFAAVVDGTDGDTYLNDVQARLGDTQMVAKGAVEGIPGVKGRRVKVHVKIDDGRIEDLLQLTMKSGKPVLNGQVALHTDLLLPPGPDDVVDRLRLDGQFDLSSAKFTDRGVQQKLAGMSTRARGLDPDEAPATVMTELEGRFRMADGTIAFPQLRFRIPGAAVHLAGGYALRGEALDFDGTLRMQATISEAAGGGVKSILLKVVDPFFKKKGAGTVLPIKVQGTPAEPKFGLDVVKTLTPK